MDLFEKYRVQLCSLIVFSFVSFNSFAACTETDIPLGSGIISTGTQISKTVENQEANGRGGNDGNFTYSFNSGGAAARCGRHADGTWWVAPASGQSKVNLTGISSNLPIKAEDNPDPAVRGFLDNAEDYGNYDASKNIIPNLPISYPLNSDNVTSVFTAIQRSNGCGTAAITDECIEFADFLTVYRSAPTSGGRETIRPTIFGNTKQVYTWRDFDRSRVPSIAGADWNYDNNDVLGLISKWTATTEGFSIPICDANRTNCSFVSEGGRAFRSHAVIDDYAAGGQQNRVLSYLLGDQSDVINDVEDRALLAATIAYGVDIITLVGDSPSTEQYAFSSGAGQFMNAANFSYFAAALSPRDQFLWSTMSVEVRSWLDLSTVAAPQEIQQIYDSGNGPVWGDANPDFDDFGRRRYWAELTNGLTHDNSDNWVVFETQTAGDRFLLQDDASGEIVPASCNIVGRGDPNSYCRDSTVIVNDILMGFFDHDPKGSYIELAESVPAGTIIQVSPITERFQGGLGGNRASGDPHGFVDGPPGVPGSGYFQVSGGPRIEWAGIVQAMPELCEVVNTPSLVSFVERYLDSGLQMGNDPCAPPSAADVSSGICDVFRSRNCVDYGLVNNGTVRWGPDPRDNTQCVNNNTLLTLSGGDWVESFENRGDNGRYSRLDGVRNNNLPQTYPNQYIAFKGDRDCLALLGEDGGDGGAAPIDSGEMCIPIKSKQGKVALICL